MPASATVGADGTFLWVPSSTQSGIYHPEFIATDGEGRDSCKVTIEVLDHAGAPGGLDGLISRVADVRGDQGGWLRVLIAAAPNDDPVPGFPVIGCELWRRIAGQGALAAGSVSTGARDIVPRLARRPARLEGFAVAGKHDEVPGTVRLNKDCGVNG
jgi:hypothetical protein